MRFVRLSQQADAETSAPEELSSFRVGTRHHGFRSSCWPACWLLTGPVKEDTQDEPEINPKVEGPKIQVTQAHRVHPRVHTSKSLLDADLCQVAVDPDEPRTAEVPVVQAKPLECVRRKRMHTQSLRVAAGLRPHVPARWIQRQLPLSCRRQTMSEQQSGRDKPVELHTTVRGPLCGRAGRASRETAGSLCQKVHRLKSSRLWHRKHP